MMQDGILLGTLILMEPLETYVGGLLFHKPQICSHVSLDVKLICAIRLHHSNLPTIHTIL
jgi:hypothetical protein